MGAVFSRIKRFFVGAPSRGRGRLLADATSLGIGPNQQRPCERQTVLGLDFQSCHELPRRW
jgi:hypothetical protein